MSETPFEAPAIESIAALLPAFEFESLIAQGGMGAVYKARQLSLDRDVAVKILPRELSEDPAFRASFRAEAKAMARLTHPNLIGVFDSGDVDGLLYIVMELVPGKSLYHSAYQQAIDPKQAAEIVIGVCKGLAHAHENGIIHRDIKPANILMTLKCEPKIGDFGLAQTAGPDTQGIVMGTPGYTAPEVVTHPDQTDKSSDIFSTGVLLRELLTGSPPESGMPAVAIKDPTLVQICNKAAHDNPSMRYPDAQAMADALEQWMKKPKAVVANAVPYTPPSQQFASAKSESSSPLKLAFIVLLLTAVGYFSWLAMQPDNEKQSPPATAGTPTKSTEDTRTKDTSKPSRTKAPVVASAPTKPEPDKPPSVTDTSSGVDYEARIDSLNDLRHLLVDGKRDEMPEGTITVGDNLYFFVSSPMKWVDAHRFAGLYDAHLPLIEGDADIDWLDSQVTELDSDELWIGARAFGSGWHSIDGAPWKRPKPHGSGAFGAIAENGVLLARDDSAERPFFIQWHLDGKNPSHIKSMLKRAAETIGTSNPIFPLGTQHRGDRRTFIVWRQIDAEAANQMALSSGGRLMELTTEEDADWLDKRFARNGPQKGFWLGGQHVDGKWAWRSGAPWTIERWSNGSPTQSGGCLAVIPREGWANIESSTRIAGLIIEWDVLANATTVGADAADEEVAPVLIEKNLPPALADLRAKAEGLLRKHDDKRKLELKANAKDYNFKLGVWIKGAKSEAEVAKRTRTAGLVEARKDSNRIPDGIPTDPGPVFPGDLLDLTGSYQSRQKSIDSRFTNEASTIRKFYVSNLQTIAEKSVKNGEEASSRIYFDRIKAAADTQAWVASFEGLSPDHPKFPEFVITSATFGIDEDIEDVSGRVTELFGSGMEKFHVDGATLEAEPNPDSSRELKIAFIANGAVGSRSWSAGEDIHPENLLEELGVTAE